MPFSHSFSGAVRRIFLPLLTSMVLAAGTAHAEWPTDRPIQLVVPNAPGGSGDVIARALAQHVSQQLGTSVVVEYKPGATGVIGGQYVSRAAPDGYTMLLSSTGAMAIVPSLSPNMPYDVEKAFEPVIKVVESYSVLAVSADKPWKTIPDLVAASRETPGSMSFASGGNGTLLHLQGELLKQRSGMDMVHVPYKGDAQAVSDLLAGHVSMMFVPTQAITEHVQAGRLRVIATTAPQRTRAMPQVPTMAEAGVKDFAAGGWYGIFLPAKTPAAIVQRLNAVFDKALKDPAVAGALTHAGLTVAGGEPGRLRTTQHEDIARWAQVLKVVNLKPTN